MAQMDVQQRLAQVLRAGALGGSERDLPLDDPLGEAGLGLDSLALVQFLVAVEREFGIRIPVDVWARADLISLRDCAGIVIAACSGGQAADES